MQAPDRTPFSLAAWLTQLGLPQYLTVFEQNDIDAEVLPSLTAQDLTDLGVSSIGHRRKLLEAMSRLRQDPDGAPQSPQATAPQVTPAPTPTPSAERRQITVMFCDLVGSTALSAQLDPEDLNDLMTAYRSRMASLIQQYHGHIAQYLGDGVLAYFGYPKTHEHDAENSLHAALSIVQAMQQLPTPIGVQAQVRIGIATGPVLVSHLVQDGSSSDVGAIGETPNLAARLQSMAQPSTVVISASTRALVRELFDCTDLGSFTLKGFAAPVPAWQVQSVRTGLTRYQALRGSAKNYALMGRGDELTQLLTHWQRAKAGRGCAITLSAAPGLGKSRLLEEFKSDIQSQRSPETLGQALSPAVDQPSTQGHSGADAGPAPLILQCAPEHQHTPFYPVVQALHVAAGFQALDTPARRKDKLGHLLASCAHLDELSRAALSALLQLPPSTNAEHQLAKLRPADLRGKTMLALQIWAQHQAHALALLSVEDLHWCDPSTLEWLMQLIQQSATSPLLILCTTRPEFTPPWADLPHHFSLSLSRLGAEEVKHLIADLAGSALPDALVDQIVQRSDGVPIYAVELTRLLLSQTELAQDANQAAATQAVIPASLTEALMARLDHIEHGRIIAQYASILGREFLLRMLQSLTQELPQAQQGIARLIDAGIFKLAQTPQGDTLTFEHMLIRDAAYQFLLRKVRVELHLRAAHVITTDFADIAQHRPELLAYHYGEGGEILHAVDYGERAAKRTFRRSAAQETLAHLQTALSRIQSVTTTQQSPDGKQRDLRELDLLLLMVGPQLQLFGYGSQQVRHTVDRAVALCERLDAAHRMVPALTLKWLAQLGSQNMTAAYATGKQVYDASLKGSVVDQLLGLRVWGSAQMFHGEFAQAAQCFERFIALYRPNEHEELLNAVGATRHSDTIYLTLAEVHTLLGNKPHAKHWQQFAINTAKAYGQPNSLCQVLVFAGGFLSLLQREGQAVQTYALEIDQLCHTHRLPSWQPFGDYLAGMATHLLTQNPQGLQLAKAALEQLVLSPPPMMSTWYILLADAFARAELPQEGLSLLDTVKIRVENGELWLAAEFHRVRGLLLGMLGQEAKLDLELAIAIATEQGAAPFLLRAQEALALTSG